MYLQVMSDILTSQVSLVTAAAVHLLPPPPSVGKLVISAVPSSLYTWIFSRTSMATILFIFHVQSNNYSVNEEIQKNSVAISGNHRSNY